VDFKLRIPCSVFLTAIPIKTDKFAELLASDELTAKIKLACNGPSLPEVRVLLFFNHYRFKASLITFDLLLSGNDSR